MFREIINFYENKGCRVLLIIELEATVPLDVGLINETLTKKSGGSLSFSIKRAVCLLPRTLLLVSICGQKLYNIWYAVDYAIFFSSDAISHTQAR